MTIEETLQRDNQTFQNHFLSMLATCYSDFPISEWGRLLPQSQMTGKGPVHLQHNVWTKQGSVCYWKCVYNKVDKQATQCSQLIVGIFLHYGRAVEQPTLPALNEIATQQLAPTTDTVTKTKMLMDFFGHSSIRKTSLLCRKHATACQIWHSISGISWRWKLDSWVYLYPCISSFKQSLFKKL